MLSKIRDMTSLLLQRKAQVQNQIGHKKERRTKPPLDTPDQGHNRTANMADAPCGARLKSLLSSFQGPKDGPGSSFLVKQILALTRNSDCHIAFSFSVKSPSRFMETQHAPMPETLSIGLSLGKCFGGGRMPHRGIG